MNTEVIQDGPIVSDLPDILKPHDKYIDTGSLAPHEANLRARPEETPEARAIRVEMTARSIAANGQLYPVLVVESIGEDEFDDDGAPIARYEYIDGGARVDAIAALNDPDGSFFRKWSDESPNLKVWCRVVSPEQDLYRIAITSNLHRTQNTVWQMALIVADVKERNSYTGRGAQARVAEYLGIGENRVSEYAKILRAPKPIRDLVASGEIGSVEAALRLMQAPPESQTEVLNTAQEIARDEREAREAKAAKSAPPAKSAPADAPAENTAAEAEPVIHTRHVRTAVRRVTGSDSKTGVLKRSDLLEFFTSLTGLAYPEPAKKFLTYFVDVYMAGNGYVSQAIKLFDAAVGYVADENAPPVEPAPARGKKAASAKPPAATKRGRPKKVAPARPAKKAAKTGKKRK